MVRNWQVGQVSKFVSEVIVFRVWHLRFLGGGWVGVVGGTTIFSGKANIKYLFVVTSSFILRKGGKISITKVA